MAGGRSDSRPTGSIELSTGQTVDLPATVEATMAGAVFEAPRPSVDTLLPDGLRPLRATSNSAVITFLSVEYHDIGVDGIDPYDEFGVIIPATHRPRQTVPYLTALLEATNGYIQSLPVTTESAKAFGVEVWGFPKVIADITHEDEGSKRRTAVTIDGERFVTMVVDRPPSIHREDDGYSYAVKDDTLQRIPADIEANLGAVPYSTRAAVAFGDHERAAPLRDLGIDGRGRALARLAMEGAIQFHPGEPVESVER